MVVNCVNVHYWIIVGVYRSISAFSKISVKRCIIRKINKLPEHFSQTALFQQCVSLNELGNSVHIIPPECLSASLYALCEMASHAHGLAGGT